MCKKKSWPKDFMAQQKPPNFMLQWMFDDKQSLIIQLCLVVLVERWGDNIHGPQQPTNVNRPYTTT
jgi:hypothetical protein